VEFAEEIFGNISKRLLRNVLLKFYNFFLVPIQMQLWSYIQSRVSSLTNEELVDKFELNNAKISLQQDELKLKQNLSTLVEQEKGILKQAAIYSHPEFETDN